MSDCKTSRKAGGNSGRGGKNFQSFSRGSRGAASARFRKGAVRM